jgi:naphthoate synthase
VNELYTALEHARSSSDVGCVLLTGNGPSPKDGGWAFCSSGDQRIRGKDGYKYEAAEGGADPARLGRLHILEVQRLIRFMPKVVIAVVPGWAIGGRHSLHVVCDLTLASREHAVFKQTDADVASFDSGYGSALLARQVGQKRAREIFFVGRNYSAQEAFDMGMVNRVVPHAELEPEALAWAGEILTKSPTAIRMLKFGFNLLDDGLVGQRTLRRGSDAVGLRNRRSPRGKRCVPRKAPAGFSTFPLALLIGLGGRHCPACRTKLLFTEELNVRIAESYLIDDQRCALGVEGIRHRGSDKQLPRTRGRAGSDPPLADCALLLIDAREGRKLGIVASGHGGYGTVVSVLALAEREYIARALRADDGAGPGRLFQALWVHRQSPAPGQTTGYLDLDERCGEGWGFA